MADAGKNPIAISHLSPLMAKIFFLKITNVGNSPLQAFWVLK